MDQTPEQFEIHETRSCHGFRLSVSGELDLATAPILEDRLTRLRATHASVRLDLSRLTFMDSAGIHVLVQMFGDAEAGHWQLRIEPDVTPQVMQALKLMQVDRILSSGQSTAP